MGEGAVLDTSRGGRHIIERPRLTRLLTESESRVMLLVAPAGYGKTTLARQWLADRPHVWYQATSASSDVAALVLGVASASSEIVENVGESIRGRLQTLSDAAAEAESLATDLADDLADWPADVRLVVDDYHLLAETEGAETFMASFASATSLPLLILSRTRPAFVTAKSLLYGDVVEFGRTVLAMTHEEAAEALADVHDEVPGLVALAEGWPAVIGLAALIPDPFPSNASEIPETLHQYLAEELFDAVASDMRRAAVKLSIAPRIDDAVAQALFGAQRSILLAHCHRSGFLTKTFDAYEMHPLVRQFLRTKVSDLGVDEVRETAEVIATTFADNDCWDEAISVAGEFGHVEVMLRVLNDALDVLLSEGRLTTLRRWLDLVRPSAPASPIVQLASLEIDFRTGDWTAAASKARQLARVIETENSLASRVFLRAGQMAHIGDRQDDALRLFTAAKQQARSPMDLRNALWSRLLTLCDVERRAEAEATLEEIEKLPALRPDDLLRTAQARLQFATRWGGLVDALDGVSGVADLIDDSNDPLVRTGFLQTYGAALGLVARYQTAEPVAARQLQEAERYHLEWVVPHALQMGAVAQMGMRDFDRALKSIDRAVAIAESQGNLHTQVNGLVLRARIFLCRGSPERAVALFKERDTPFTSPGMEGEYLAMHALSLACCSRTKEAETQLVQSERVSNQIDAAPLRAFARVIVAHTEKRRANRALYEALRLAQDTGNFNAFVCAYRAFPALLDGLQTTKIEGVQAFTSLVVELDPSHAEKIGLAVPARKKSKQKPLTRREREVFDLMSQGLSNREIAKTLWISESTAKVHVHHVLAKMGVRTRTEAVAAGREDD